MFAVEAWVGGGAFTRLGAAAPGCVGTAAAAAGVRCGTPAFGVTTGRRCVTSALTPGEAAAGVRCGAEAAGGAATGLAAAATGAPGGRGTASGAPGGRGSPAAPGAPGGRGTAAAGTGPGAEMVGTSAVRGAAEMVGPGVGACPAAGVITGARGPLGGRPELSGGVPMPLA
jgi:hypothetical protein